MTLLLAVRAFSSCPKNPYISTTYGSFFPSGNPPTPPYARKSAYGCRIVAQKWVLVPMFSSGNPQYGRSDLFLLLRKPPKSMHGSTYAPHGMVVWCRIDVFPSAVGVPACVFVCLWVCVPFFSSGNPAVCICAYPQTHKCAYVYANLLLRRTMAVCECGPNAWDSVVLGLRA